MLNIRWANKRPLHTAHRECFWFLFLLAFIVFYSRKFIINLHVFRIYFSFSTTGIAVRHSSKNLHGTMLWQGHQRTFQCVCVCIPNEWERMHWPIHIGRSFVCSLQIVFVFLWDIYIVFLFYFILLFHYENGFFFSFKGIFFYFYSLLSSIQKNEFPPTSRNNEIFLQQIHSHTRRIFETKTYQNLLRIPIANTICRIHLISFKYILLCLFTFFLFYILCY